MDPSVSIIIPCREVQSQAQKCIERCLEQDYPDFEIMVLPDSLWETPYADRVKVVPTGAVGPAVKRDQAANVARGEILAFIDDDAYPAPGWLAKAVRHFSNQEIAAVGGPGVTPEEDGLLEKASGKVYESFMGGGSHSFRYTPKEKRDVDDYPSCNFFVRSSVFKEFGGFDTRYWPGEDTKLALDITDKLGKRIVYDPEVLIYHHRRKLFLPHLAQAWRYANPEGTFC